jgi:hypothetical protein
MTASPHSPRDVDSPAQHPCLRRPVADRIAGWRPVSPRTSRPPPSTLKISPFFLSSFMEAAHRDLQLLTDDRWRRNGPVLLCLHQPEDDHGTNGATLVHSRRVGSIRVLQGKCSAVHHFSILVFKQPHRSAACAGIEDRPIPAYELLVPVLSQALRNSVCFVTSNFPRYGPGASNGPTSSYFSSLLANSMALRYRRRYCSELTPAEFGTATRYCNSSNFSWYRAAQKS